MGILDTVSDVGICSNALQALGSQSINDFNQNSEGARLSSNIYAQARNELLRDHPWNSCTKRVELAPDAEKPAFGYQYQFSVPGDALRILGVNDNLGWQADYVIEGSKILTNCQTAFLRYIWRNDVPSTWGPGLVQLMTMKMTWLLTYAITRDASLTQLNNQLYMRQLQIEKSVDGSEEPPAYMTGHPLIGSRY